MTGLSKVAGCRGKSPPTWLGIGHVLCLAFLYGWCFLNKISLDWPLTLTTQLSTSKLSDNPEMSKVASLSTAPPDISHTLRIRSAFDVYHVLGQTRF